MCPCFSSIPQAQSDRYTSPLKNSSSIPPPPRPRLFVLIMLTLFALKMFFFFLIGTLDHYTPRAIMLLSK